MLVSTNYFSKKSAFFAAIAIALLIMLLVKTVLMPEISSVVGIWCNNELQDEDDGLIAVKLEDNNTATVYFRSARYGSEHSGNRIIVRTATYEVAADEIRIYIPSKEESAKADIFRIINKDTITAYNNSLTLHRQSSAVCVKYLSLEPERR